MCSPLPKVLTLAIYLRFAICDFLYRPLYDLTKKWIPYFSTVVAGTVTLNMKFMKGFLMVLSIEKKL